MFQGQEFVDPVILSVEDYSGHCPALAPMGQHGLVGKVGTVGRSQVVLSCVHNYTVVSF